jgi:beta-lactamase regulating signal transducer with metallopeptidase domain
MTVVFAVPSFLLLEPRAIVEPMGNALILLALFGAALVGFGAVNALLIILRTSRTIHAWTDSAEPVPSTAPFPVLRIRDRVPPLIAVGIVRPKILLSGPAEFVLNGNELRTGVRHEIAHILRRDNLKKLILRFVAFPGMRGLDGAWIQASEMAADEAAVSSTADALDLAAALIKLSKLTSVGPIPGVSAALIQGHASLINARVERLISWSERSQIAHEFSMTKLLVGIVPTAVLFATSYFSLLGCLHQATEWLVR